MKKTKALKQDLDTLIENISDLEISISADELRSLLNSSFLIKYKKNIPIDTNHNNIPYFVYVLEGTLVGEQENPFTANYEVLRFYQTDNFCTTTEQFFQAISPNDRLRSLNKGCALLIPFDMTLEWYLNSQNIGIYLRSKLLEYMVDDRQSIMIKSKSTLKDKYASFEKFFPELIHKIPHKAIASYFGVTPEGFSRFLKQQTK